MRSGDCVLWEEQKEVEIVEVERLEDAQGGTTKADSPPAWSEASPITSFSGHSLQEEGV